MKCPYAEELLESFKGHQGPVGVSCLGCENDCQWAVPEDWEWDPKKVAMCAVRRKAL